MRIGIGYDVHRFSGKGPIRLGGVSVPCGRGLRGHSDADVLLHALADALFGAIGAPDIGEQFPSKDKRLRGIGSAVFIKRAMEQVRRAGWAVGNADATVIADAPRLAGHKVKIAKQISKLLSVAQWDVSVKAKTTEGCCPGKSGIAAYAVVLLKPLRKKRK